MYNKCQLRKSQSAKMTNEYDSSNCNLLSVFFSFSFMISKRMNSSLYGCGFMATFSWCTRSSEIANGEMIIEYLSFFYSNLPILVSLLEDLDIRFHFANEFSFPLVLFLENRLLFYVLPWKYCFVSLAYIQISIKKKPTESR